MTDTLTRPDCPVVSTEPIPTERARKPLVYLAGPYTDDDPVANTNAAIALADRVLLEQLVTPIIPHLTMAWHLVSPKPYTEWMAYDLDVLARCDALLRFGGSSSGADSEMAFARSQGIPVFFTIATLHFWAGGR